MGSDPGPSDEAPRIGVLISGRGSNLQALIDAIAGGRLEARIAIVISSRSDAPGVESHRQAIAHGVRITGATVHLVTAELDGGPIVVQCLSSTTTLRRRCRRAS